MSLLSASSLESLYPRPSLNRLPPPPTCHCQTCLPTSTSKRDKAREEASWIIPLYPSPLAAPRFCGVKTRVFSTRHEAQDHHQLIDGLVDRLLLTCLSSWRSTSFDFLVCICPPCYFLSSLLRLNSSEPPASKLTLGTYIYLLPPTTC